MNIRLLNSFLIALALTCGFIMIMAALTLLAAYNPWVLVVLMAMVAIGLLTSLIY